MLRYRKKIEIEVWSDQEWVFWQNISLFLSENADPEIDKDMVKNLLTSIAFEPKRFHSFFFADNLNLKNHKLGIGIKRLMIQTKKQLRNTRNFINERYRSYSKGYQIFVCHDEVAFVESPYYKILFVHILIWNYHRYFIDKGLRMELAVTPILIMTFAKEILTNSRLMEQLKIDPSFILTFQSEHLINNIYNSLNKRIQYEQEAHPSSRILKEEAKKIYNVMLVCEKENVDLYLPGKVKCLIIAAIFSELRVTRISSGKKIIAYPFPDEMDSNVDQTYYSKYVDDISKKVGLGKKNID